MSEEQPSSSSSPDDEFMDVYVSGERMQLGRVVSVEHTYITFGDEARAHTEIEAGDTIHFNGSIAGYALEAGDVIGLIMTEPSTIFPMLFF